MSSGAAPITILPQSPSLQGAVGATATTPPAPSNAIDLVRLGAFAAPAGGNAEVVSYDPVTDRLYILNATASQIDIVQIGAGGSLAAVGAIALRGLPGFSAANSVAIKDGIVAVAYQAAAATDRGSVALFDRAGALTKVVPVGVQPDQITFTPDGTRILVANEAEAASTTVNPNGTISIISLAGGAANAVVTNTITFDSLNGQEAALRAAGLAIFPGQSAAADIEPEYIAVSPDGTRAYVTLQEVNGVAVIDLTNPNATRPISILPLGGVDHRLPGNEFDPNDTNGISLRSAPITSLLQPDSIASYAVGGVTYFITANEGDGRVGTGLADIDVQRLSSASVVLDPTAFPNAAALKANADLGRLNVLTRVGDTDGDGDIDQLFTFGGRGITIFRQEADGSLTKIRDTGGEFEKIIAAQAPDIFNQNQGNAQVDNRSDDKGPEPEGVAIGVVNGRTYAFVGLERTGGVMVYDVTEPASARFVTYERPLVADAGPEVLTFISAADSPTGTALVVSANEVGNTTTVYEAINRISAIQGTGAASPMVGQTVTVDAIVVGDFQNGDADAKRNLNGFYLQEEAADGDGNPLTSEGVFVFEGTGAFRTNVAEGDRVRVTGTVSEFNGETQITATAISVVQAGAVANVNTLAVTIDLPSAGVVGSGATAQPNLEAFEGMLVRFPETLTITEQFNLDRFNEIRLVEGARPSQFTQFAEPDAAGNAAYLQQLAARQIVYDDGLNTQNQAIELLDGFGPLYNTPNAPRMGDTISGLTGVLGYGPTNTYRVRAIDDGANAFTDANPRPAAPEDVGGRLKVGSFNVLNYFTTLDAGGAMTANGFQPRGANSAAELTRQTDKLVATLTKLNPDVLGLIELENNFLPGASGNAVEFLVGQLNAKLGAGTYAYVNPGQQFVGGDAIAVGFIYKPSAVRVAMDTTIQILDDTDPQAAALLSQSPIGRIFNGVDTSRAALAVTFEEVATGEDFTAVANHLKSKSGAGTGANADQGDGQGPFQQQRELAARALADWVATNPTGSKDKDVLLLGDFNAYFKEDAIDVLKGAGFENLQETRIANPYSYVFDGQLGSLDYVFTNQSLSGQVTGITEWHINADEADALDYNLDFGRNPAYFSGSIPARVSDHDPLLVGLSLADQTGPVLASSSPADNAMGVAFGANLTLTFNEAVKAGAGSLTITDGAGDIRAIAVSDASQITVSGNVVTIDPAADLRPGASYDVVAPAGSFTDIAGNAFAGVALDRLDFTTASGLVLAGVGAANDVFNGSVGNDRISGGAGNDVIAGGLGDDSLAGGEGVDTLVYGTSFANVRVTQANGLTVVIGPEGTDTVAGFERVLFSDATIVLNDGSPLVDDLFYLAANKDVLRAGQDADAHYAAFGFKEGRDPSGFFSTNGYLAANQDVARSGANPLAQYDAVGFTQGRDPSALFDNEFYLARNADVRAAGLDPLKHYLEYGQAEGRAINAAIGKAADIKGGFDAEYYLLSNADVARAASATADSFAYARSHFDQFGWKEGRNPNAVFDTKGYLAAYADVARAGINPLTHYDAVGFKEGRDPSVGFDSSAYLANHADVARAGIDPMQHYLQYGLYEGRSAFGDATFGAGNVG